MTPPNEIYLSHEIFTWFLGKFLGFEKTAKILVTIVGSPAIVRDTYNIIQLLLSRNAMFPLQPQQRYISHEGKLEMISL